MEIRNYMAEDYNNPEFNRYRDGPGSEIKGSGSKKYTVFVNRLPPELTDAGLRNIFSKAGVVKSAVVKRPKLGKDYTFGFVEYRTLGEAGNAIRMFQGFKAGKYTLTVCMARDNVQTDDALVQQLLRDNNMLDIPPVVESESVQPVVNGLGDARTRSMGRGSAVRNLNLIIDRKPGNHLQSRAAPQVRTGPSPAPQGNHFGQPSPGGKPRGPPQERHCIHCGMEAHNQCGRCKLPYCSAACQQADWPQHKLICRPAQVSQADVTEEISSQVSQMHLQEGSTPGMPPKQPALPSPPQDGAMSPQASGSPALMAKSPAPPAALHPAPMAKSPAAKSPPAQQMKGKPKNQVNSGLTTPPVISPGSQSPNGKVSAERPRHMAHSMARACLPVKTPVQVCVSHVESPHEIWVQRFPDEANQLTVISQKIYKSDAGGQVTSPTVGELYGSEYQRGWYRAEVSSVEPEDGKVRVLYVDYGNSDVVSIDQLRHLPDSVINHPQQGIPCCLADVVPIDEDGSWPKDIAASMLEMVYGRIFTCYAIQEYSHTYLIKLSADDGIDVAKMLFMSGLAKKGRFSPHKRLSGPHKSLPSQNPSAFSKPSPSQANLGRSAASTPIPSLMQSLKKEELEVGSSLPVIIAHIETWDAIFLQKIQNVQHLHELMQDINKYMLENSGSVNSPQVGMLCGAQYPVDTVFYRASVSRLVNKEQSEVHFVDYGNSLVVSNSNLRRLPERMFQLPAQALHCSLLGVRPLDAKQGWPKVVEAMLVELQKETYMCNVTNRTGDTYHVSLVYNSGHLKDQSIADLLVEAGDVLPYRSPNKAWSPRPNGKGRDDHPPSGQNHQHSQRGGKVPLSTPSQRNHAPNGKPSSSQPMQPKASQPKFGQKKHEWKQQRQEMSELMMEEKHISAREVERARLTVGERQKVLVQCVENPGAIWVMLGEVESVTMIAAIDQALKLPTPPKPLNRLPGEGCLCAAYITISNKKILCRAEVLQHTKLQYAVVRCLDLGIKEEVNLQHLLTLPTEAASYPAQSIQCQLQGAVRLTTSWPLEMLDKLAAVCPLDEVMTADVTGETNGVFIVDLFSDKQSVWVSEKLGLDKKQRQPRPASTPVKSLPSSQEPRRLYEAKDMKSMLEGLTVGQQVKLFVIDCRSPKDLIVQVVDQANISAYQQMTSEVVAANLDSQPNFVPEAIGELVMAKYDGAWYRAKVLSISGSNVEVLYLDFGNEDTVTQASIRAIQPQWAHLPALGIPCFLHGLVPPRSGSWPPEVLEHLVKTVTQNQSADKSFVGKIKEVKQRSLGIDLVGNDGHSLVEEIKKIMARMEETLAVAASDAEASSAPIKKVVRSEETPAMAASDVKASSAQAPPSPSLPALTASSSAKLEYYPLPMDGSREKAKVVVILSPCSIFIQPADAEAKILPMMEVLNRACSQDQKTPAEVRVGDFVAAVFCEDTLWYRARVDAILEDKYQVLFVDYGNSALVSLGEIRSLPKECCSLPIQSIHCGLAGLEDCEDIMKLAQEILEQTMEVMAVSHKNGFYWVQMRVPHTQRVINQEFGAKPCATSPAPASAAPPAEATVAATPSVADLAVYLPSSRQFNVVITSAPSPNNMFCQVVGKELLEELKVTADGLEAHCNSTALPGDFAPRVGQILGAKFSQDTKWYRGAVEEVRAEGCLVRFIDFGNAEVVPVADLRPLSPELLNRRISAINVAVYGVKPAGETWAADVMELMRMLENGEAKVEVMGVAEDGKLIVRMKLTKVKGQQLNENLLDLLADCADTVLDNTGDAPAEEVQKQVEALLARNAAKIGAGMPGLQSA